jgi:hypothetical protein
MTHWLMKHTQTGETTIVPPDKFSDYFRRGYRPIASRETTDSDYQSKKKKENPQ